MELDFGGEEVGVSVGVGAGVDTSATTAVFEGVAGGDATGNGGGRVSGATITAITWYPGHANMATTARNTIALMRFLSFIFHQQGRVGSGRATQLGKSIKSTLVYGY